MANEKYAHNKEKASHMKKIGEDRHHGRCPICNNVVSLGRKARQEITGGLSHHIATCRGRTVVVKGA